VTPNRCGGGRAGATVGALIGPAQAGVRVLEMAGRGRHHPIWTLAISTFAIAAGILLLAADYGVAGVALVLYGGGNCLFPIARGARSRSPSSARTAIPLSWDASHARRSLRRPPLRSLERGSLPEPGLRRRCGRATEDAAAAELDEQQNIGRPRTTQRKYGL